MKISNKNMRIIPGIAFALCTVGVIAGSAGAASSQSPTAKAQHQQKREAHYEQRLQKAVTNGKLTSEQEQAIVAEHKTLVAELQAANSSDRKQVRTKVRTEAKAWAQQHGVDAKWLLKVGHGHHNHKK